MNPVRLTRNFAVMEQHSQDPFNPHGVFPQWSPWPVYPYPYYGSMQKRVRRTRYFMPAIENEYLRVTVAADIGGRIWDVYDKIGRRHLANFNTGVRTYNAGMGLNYTTGGIECNFPTAHSPTTNRPREATFRRGPDGSASILISEFDQTWRTRWSVAYTLYPGRSFVELKVRAYNRTPEDIRCMYWNNCGFVLNENTQFIFPEDAGAKHGRQENTLSWPLWRGRDISFWRHVPPAMLGLYMLNAAEPYFGYYDHGAHFGLVHYADLADLPAKKYWTWGTDPDMIRHYRKTHHTLDEVYGEVQSGRTVIQEHTDRVPPETESVWREMWYPVRDTGGFNGAGPGAAMTAELLDASSERPRLRVRAIGNGVFPDARLVVASDGVAPAEAPLPLEVRNAVERVIPLKGKAGPDRHTVVSILAADGRELARCRLRRPSERDSWREAIQVSEEIKPVGADELFWAAEFAAKDWGNHDLKAQYEKVLRADEGFAPARRELGKLALRRGEYDEAVNHLTAALQRDGGALETRYFLGLARLRAGRTDEARAQFELANRYDGEARALVRLAELRMRERHWHHALDHLDRLAASRPTLTRPRGLRAACLRQLGRFAEAADEIRAARKIDADDPFLQFEEMFIQAGGVRLGRTASGALRRLLDQVRREEPPLLEAAFDYLAADLYEEAFAIVRAIPRPGPLAVFVSAWASEKSGRRAEALRLLQRACALDPTRHFAWRLEMIPILEWASARLPKNPRPLFHLGNLLMARRRAEEGARLWERAEALGEEHYLLYANLGHYHRAVTRDKGRALRYFQEAERRDPTDPYMKAEVCAALKALDRPAAAARFLERRMKAVLRSPPLAYELLNLYLEDNRYRKFDALCRKADFSINWQLRGPQSLWSKRHFQEALQLIQAGRLERALELLEALGRPAPANLGIRSYEDRPEERRWYHIGCIHERLGRPEKARECWEKAVAVPRRVGFEPAYWYREWSARYYQALALQKLGRHNEAQTYLDGMEQLAQNPKLNADARRELLARVHRALYAPDDEKDPTREKKITVQTEAEA